MYIHFALNILIVIILVVVIIRISTVVANYVGEQLGIGKFIINLWNKIRKSRS